jgi:CRP-like cAMP-binding protein
MRSADVRRLTEQAARAQSEGDPGRAAEALEQLCQLVPDEPGHWKQLARAFQQLARPLEAVAALVRAAELYTRAELGIQAIAVCKWILELDPTHTATLDRLARLQEASGMPGRALERQRGMRLPRPPEAIAPPPIEEVMLRDVVEPATAPDREGQREIPIEPPPAPPSPGEERRTARGLVSTPLFGRLGARALRRLIQATRLVRLAEGEVLFRQGDRADALYVVVEGAVVPIAEDGTRHRLSVLQPGAFFGEIALVTDEPRNATIEALVDSELLAIDRDVIGELLEDEPEVLAVTLRFLRERLVDRLLTTSPVFHGIDRDEGAALVRAFRLLEVAEGSALVEQGAPSRALFLVLAGELRVLEEHPHGEKEIAILRAGDPCGEMSLLARAPAVASVVAVRKSWLLLLPRADFARVMSLHPAIGKRLAWIADARRRSR